MDNNETLNTTNEFEEFDIKENAKLELPNNKTAPIVIFKCNNFVDEMTNNEVATELAKQANDDIKNQEKIAKKIHKVVQKNTNADIDHVDVNVKEKEVNNKVRRTELNNTLLKLHKERIYIKKEQKHRLQMQKLGQRKEKYLELLTRHKKITFDENGKTIINMPNTFTLFFLIILDSFVQFLNLFSEVLGKINKTFIKGFLIILILLFVFISPFREWIFGLIGIK